MKRLLLILLTTCLCFTGPQVKAIEISTDSLPASEISAPDTIPLVRRRPVLAAGEVFGLNMLVWGFNHFIMNEDFARINARSIKTNLSTLPVWDTDQFSTNLIAHPYHGSLYFNSARSNGMGILGVRSVYLRREPDVGIFHGERAAIG